MMLSFIIIISLLSFYAECITRDLSQSEWSGRMLTASDGASGDHFGASVSLDTSYGYAIVGADRALANKGAAYVFERNYDSVLSPSGITVVAAWGQKIKLSATDGVAGDRFGTSVAIYGSWAIVGAPMNNPGAAGAGAAYIFNRDGSGNWAPSLKVTYPTPAANYYFGSSVDMSSEFAVVGCPRCSVGGYSGAGAACVYQSSSSWSLLTTLTSFYPRSGAQFGNCVSISEKHLAIGAHGDRHEDYPASSYGMSGVVYVWTKSSMWTEYRRLTAASALLTNLLMFGLSVSVRGDNIVVGTRIKSTVTAVGGIHRFTLNGDNTWLLATYYTFGSSNEDPAKKPFTGSPVHSDGAHAIVGDLQYNSNGAAFLFQHRMVAYADCAQRLCPYAPATWMLV